MKRKLSLLLAMVLAMTMVMGIGVTAFSATPEVDYAAVTPFDTGIIETGDSDIVAFTFTNFTSGIEINIDKILDDTIIISTGDSRELLDIDSRQFIYSTSSIESSFEIFWGRSETPKNAMRIYWNPSNTTLTEYYYSVEYYEEHYGHTDPPGSDPNKVSAPTHIHNFTWQTIYEATPNSDGLEGEVCSCGATRNTQPISAMDYAINKYADQMIKAAKPGQKITLEFGEFNSFPRYMMEKVAARMNDNITFVFKFKQNKKMQTVTIEPGTAIDLQYDWYGPDKMKELYGAE